MRRQLIAGEGDFNENDLVEYWTRATYMLESQAEANRQSGDLRAEEVSRGQAYAYGHCANELAEITGLRRRLIKPYPTVMTSYTAEGHSVTVYHYPKYEKAPITRAALVAIQAAERAAPERRARADREYFARIAGRQSIARLSPREFEEFAGRWFQRQDYAVEVTQQSSDRGVDLRLRRDGRTGVVQVKHYPGGAVGRPVAQNIYGQMIAERADSAYVVTSGRFTAEAQRWAADNGVVLIDGEELAHTSRDLTDADDDVTAITGDHLQTDGEELAHASRDLADADDDVTAISGDHLQEEPPPSLSPREAQARRAALIAAKRAEQQ